MLSILSITFPIFAAIALGYTLVRKAVFGPSDMRILGKYVINVALPALLCGTVAKRDLQDILDISYTAVFAVGGIATIAVVYLLLTLQQVGPARKAIAAMGSSCPNSAYVGYPVMLLLFPDKAGIVLALNFVVENFLLVPVCLLLLETSRDRGDKSLLRVIGKILWSILTRPMFVGLFVGLAIMVLGIELPSAGFRLLDMLAAAASALALVVIGGTLVGLPLQGNLGLSAQILVGKLILNPALTAAAALMLPLIGLPPLGPEMYAAVILSASMPMLSMFVIFSQDYGHEGVASIALLSATIGAFFTLSALLALLG